MTPRQYEAMVIIRTHKAVHKTWPTYAYIAKRLGLASAAGAYNLVSRLVERGYLERIKRGFKLNTVVAIFISCCSGCSKLFEPGDMTWFTEENINLCPDCVRVKGK